MTRIAIPALLVLLMVVGFVGAAGWNTSGDPLLVVTLTERELPLLGMVSEDEDRGLQLQFAYESRHDPLDARNWLPDQRLRAIGFALDVPVGTPQAVQAYDHVPPRVAWVVFEYDGPQWRALERRRALEEADKGLQRPAYLRSRLVPVDAGVDFDALRTRYSSGHLIVRGIIGLSYFDTPDRGRVLHGTLRQLVPPQVAVPTRLRPMLDTLVPSRLASGEPRYDVELALGTLGLPYVRTLRLR